MSAPSSVVSEEAVTVGVSVGTGSGVAALQPARISALTMIKPTSSFDLEKVFVFIALSILPAFCLAKVSAVGLPFRRMPDPFYRKILALSTGKRGYIGAGRY